jgi:outer membrane autotransporter protein
MIKSVFAASAALSLSAGAAFAGPYVNVETNAGWVGNDYAAAVTDLHVGYEGDLGSDATYYVQGGPALVAIDGEDTETEFSGKAGVGISLSESLSAYGEVSFLTDGSDSDDTSYGSKLGLKFTF